MTKIERFEDLQSWQKARQLTNFIYDLTQHPKFSEDSRLVSQIQDASGSVMDNIAEGFDSETNPEFIRLLKISKHSAKEVQSELSLALDRNYVTQDELITAYNLATETKHLINGMVKYL